MRNPLVVMALVGIAASVSACSTDPSNTLTTKSSNTYTIRGELVTVGDIVPTDTEAHSDWATATVAITHEKKVVSGEPEIVELASTSIVDGEFAFSGVIEHPTEVTITAIAGGEEISSTALLVPDGEEISLLLVDNMSGYPRDRLYVLGALHGSQDPTKKFTIRGEFSNVHQDVDMATFGAYGQKFEDGRMVSYQLGYVMLDEGNFLIEADVADSQIAYVYFWSDYSEDRSFAMTPFIAEPGSNYEVDLRATDDLFITSGNGKHAELIESWKQSPEYQAKFDAYEKSYLAFEAAPDAKSNVSGTSVIKSEGTETDSETIAETKEATGTDSESPTTLSQETTDGSETTSGETPASAREVDEECQHVVIDQARSSTSTVFFSNEPNEDTPEHVLLSWELTQIRDAELKKIVNEWNEPESVLLAMELGAIDAYDEDRSDAIKVYDKLAKQLEPGIVSQRVTPARISIADAIAKVEADSALQQGHKVPEFTLANSEGEKIVLYDLLAEREITLIDFWASWCGPCIETFPELKRLYTAYKGHGFEIIGISIDDNFEDWNDAAIELSLPWIDVGELKDFEGPVAVSYGVGAIPKTFLVDESGCLLKKNVHPGMLEEALVQRFGDLSAIE